jgi:uncharacterized protein with PIN domain
MLGKLARFMRIFGYDTVYANDLIDHFKLDPVPDEKLKEFAIEHQRIIITKDFPFYQTLDHKALFLKGEGIYNYFHQIKTRFNLEFNFTMERGRCSKCNSELVRIKDKNSVQRLVKPDTFESHSVFYQCLNPACKKVFWEGTHIIDIIKNMYNYEKSI